MKNPKAKFAARRQAFSLLELLAVVTILGIIAVIVIPRMSVSVDTASTNSEAQQKADINKAVERWYFNTGSWPASNLSDIGADPNYFPDGVPTPFQGGSYTLDSDNRAVVTP